MVMSLRFRIIPLFILLAVSYGIALAQNAEDNKPGGIPKMEQDKDSGPKNIQESMEKMRIEKEKKDLEEMINRGDEVLDISGELVKSFEHKGKLTSEDLEKLARVERLAKKIREELGGRADDDKDDDDDGVGIPSLADAVNTLRVSAGTLYSELKKTTRFTISATAIQSTNTVLRLARFLKISK